MLHPKYRPDIDGLRAVAVISVVLFHAFPEEVKGGFVGVDIFFVISGFLISLIILNNLHADNFSFAEFYFRRVRRIFPALILVMASTLFCGWFLLFQDEYRQLAKHVASGVGFVSNIVLWSESGYFDNDAQFKPLLHLWSLGVEEQYYLLWPLLAWIAWRLRLQVFLPVSLIIAASFFYNIYSVKLEPAAAFYLPVTRFWELMLGSFLASAVLAKSDWLDACNSHANWLSFLGAILIGFGIYFLSSEMLFPGWLALIPVSGAGLLIVAGPNALVNRRILSSKIAIWIGLISYPLYLWHWPIISFIRIVEGGVAKNSAMLVAMIVSVILAWATYQLIEKPIRSGSVKSIGVTTLCLSMLFLGGIGFSVYSSEAFSKTRLAGLVDPEIVKALGDYPFPKGLEKTSFAGENLYQNHNGDPEVLLVGDSHIEHLSPLVTNSYPGRIARNIGFLTSGGCPPIPGVFEDFHPDCANFIQRVEDYLAEHKTVNTLVIGACWNCYFIKQALPVPVDGDHYNFYFRDGDRKESFRYGAGKTMAMQSLSEFVRRLSNKYTIYFILDNPMDKRLSPVNMLGGVRGRKGLIFSSDLPSLTVDAAEFSLDPSQLSLNAELKKLIGDGDIKLVELNELVCPGNKCRPLTIDNKPIYSDTHHMRPFFVREKLVALNPVIYR